MHDVDNHGYAVLHCAARYGRDKVYNNTNNKRHV